MLARSQTAPCLLQELMRFDLSHSAHSFDIVPDACHHVYFTNHDRSRLPSPQHLPVASAVWSIAATCQRCRHHLDVVISFPENSTPCPSDGSPLHIFSYQQQDDHPPSETGGLYGFVCSSNTCRAQLKAFFRSPVLDGNDVRYLTSPDILGTRLKATQVVYPDTQAKPAVEVLRVFRTAIVDSLEKEKEKKRDIPTDNKVFRLCLGDGIESLFDRLGFLKIVPSGSNKTYWKLPNPDKHTFRPAYDELRARLEDVRDELTMLMLGRPEAEKRSIKWLPPQLQLAIFDLSRVLSIQSDDAKAFNLSNLDVRMEDLPYRALGVVPGFPDQLIAWVLRRQLTIDPEKRQSYLQCVHKIAELRQSETLQTEAAIAESLQSESGSSLSTQADQDNGLRTYSQALRFIGAEENTNDEFIWTLMTAKAAEHHSNEAKARQAVQLIASHRKSEALSNQLAGSLSAGSEMTLAKAYKTLGVSEDLENEHLIAQYEMNVKESPARESDFREALRVIAQSRSNYDLQAYSGLQPTASQPSTNGFVFDEPRPLKNIELVANIDRVGESSNATSITSKIVNDSRVSGAEVNRALKFARELGKLFLDLKTAETSVVTPTQDLARLTLINVVDRDVQRRASTITTPPPVLTEMKNMSKFPQVTCDMDEVVIDAIERTEISVQPNGTMPAVSEANTLANIDMVDGAKNESAESPDLDHDQEAVRVNGITGPTSSKEDSMTEDVNPPLDTNGILQDAPSAPPVPPRPKLSIETPQKKPAVISEVENWAKQQDVHEVMQNVLSQLRWAIKPKAHEKNGEQIDVVSLLFYGKEKYTLINEKGEQASVEPFLEILLYLSGACDIYSALDAIFDKSRVEGSAGTFQYRTIMEAPPMLQMSVSRVGYNKATGSPFKVNDPLQLHEYIYLDRYMESESMLIKRRQAWAWKAELNTLKIRRTKLTMPQLDLDAAGVLRSTSDYLKGLARHAKTISIDFALIDQALLAGLEDLAQVVADEIVELDQRINALETDLIALFEKNKDISYRLHAVFIHRGDSGGHGGHWFIYIFDAQHNLWRCYNDETILKVTNTQPIFAPTKEWMEGTSSFIVYVRDSILDEVVQAVCRQMTPVADTLTDIALDE